MIATIMMSLLFSLNFQASANDVLGRGSYFDWGRGMNGYGYCYEWAYGGGVLNGGNPVPNFECDKVNPSFYSWGRGSNGYTYCYQFAPQGWVLNTGNPVDNSWCR